jgi:hypothetical protein
VPLPRERRLRRQLYDCDFNQMLELGLKRAQPATIFDCRPAAPVRAHGAHGRALLRLHGGRRGRAAGGALA